MNTFWSVTVAVVTIANILACLWLLVWTSKKQPGEVADGAEKERMALGSKETFAKRVATDLFRYMESFQAATAISAEHMVVPMNVLDRWFIKFQDKFRRDPDFLTRREEQA